MADSHPIPTPWSQRWLHVRFRMLPMLCFVVALGGGVWLWGTHTGLHGAMGEVEAVRQVVAAPADGVLIAPAGKDWHVFQKVTAGDLLAQIDSRAAQAALETIRKTAVQLRKELAAAEAREKQGLAEIAIDHADRQYQRFIDARRLARDVEATRLEILDRQGELASNRMELRRLTNVLTMLEKTSTRSAASDQEINDARGQMEVMRDLIVGQEKALLDVEAQLKILLDRKETGQDQIAKLPPSNLASLETLLEPVRASIDVEEARMRELQLQADALTVRAQFDGIIRELLCQPGQAVRLGDQVMIVVAEKTEYVICYVRDYQRIAPKIGTEVQIRVRTLPRRMVKGVIAEVGPQVVTVPLQHLSDPRSPEWGVPIRVAFSPEANLRPGETVDITFRASH